MAKEAHPRIDVRMATEFASFEQNTGSSHGGGQECRRDTKLFRGSHPDQRGSARSMAGRRSTSSSRASPIPSAHQHRSSLRLPQTRLHRAQLYFSTWTSIPIYFTGKARRTAGASISRPRSMTTKTNQMAGGAATPPQEIPRHRPRFRDLRLQPLHRSSAGRQKIPQGRVVLAGELRPRQQPDRRHGLNSGVHDAFSLAEKWPASCNGKAADED